MEAVRALFIGNSYTFFNKMPWIVQKLAESSSRKLDVDMVTKGGVSFEWHFNNPETLERIAGEKWDFIVLQNHSLGPTQHRNKMDKYGEALCDKVNATDAQPVLYMTWARQHIPEMQDEITSAYTALAKKTGAKIAPVGVAWQNAFNEKPDLVIHTRDKSHPNPKGSYLAACVFYSTFYNESPEGLTGTITVDADELVNISEAEAGFLQAIAWRTFLSIPQALRPDPR